MAAGQGGPLDPQHIYARALTMDPSVALARQRVAELQARFGEMQASRRPQLTLDGNASVSHGTLPANQGTQNFHTLQASLGLALPNQAKAGANASGARAQLESAEYSLRAALSDLAFRANDAYYGVLKAQDAVTIAQQNLDQAERQVSDTQKRIAAGDVPQSDLLKVQVPAAQARAALARNLTALKTAQQTLNSLVGSTLDAPVQIAPAPGVSDLKMTQEEAVQRAMSNSPDVLVAQANVRAAEYTLAAAKRALDPTFSMQATHTYTTDSTTYTNLSSLGLSLSIPLSDGGVARQQVREAEAQLRQAQETLRQTQIQTRLAASSAYIAVQSAAADLASAEQVLTIAEQSAAKAQQAYIAGLTTTRDVLDALLALAQARSDVNNARYAYALAVAKLRQSMGETL